MRTKLPNWKPHIINDWTNKITIQSDKITQSVKSVFNQKNIKVFGFDFVHYENLTKEKLIIFYVILLFHICLLISSIGIFFNNQQTDKLDNLLIINKKLTIKGQVNTKMFFFNQLILLFRPSFINSFSLFLEDNIITDYTTKKKFYINFLESLFIFFLSFLYFLFNFKSLLLLEKLYFTCWFLFYVYCLQILVFIIFYVFNSFISNSNKFLIT